MEIWPCARQEQPEPLSQVFRFRGQMYRLRGQMQPQQESRLSQPALLLLSLFYRTSVIKTLTEVLYLRRNRIWQKESPLAVPLLPPYSLLKPPQHADQLLLEWRFSSRTQMPSSRTSQQAEPPVDLALAGPGV